MNKAEQKNFTNKLGSALYRQQQIVKDLEPAKDNPTVKDMYNQAVGRASALMSVYQYLELNSSIELNMLQD